MDTGLFEAVPDALLIVDAEGTILRANANAHGLFGHMPGSLVGLAVEQLMPEGVRAHHRDHRTAYASTPRVRPMGFGAMVLVGQRADGGQFPVEIALAPVHVDGGATHFLASIRDISETLRARQALERARYDRLIAQLGQDALEAKSSDALIDRIPQRLAAALGADVRIGLWRRNASEGGPRWAGVSNDEVRAVDARCIARFVTHAFRAFTEDSADSHASELIRALADCHAAAVAPLLDRGEPTGALVAWSSVASRFDHDAHHLLQSAATLVSSALQRGRTEAQLAHAQRLDSLGQLTGGIAHDFNNLLTVMSGSLQLLASESDHAPGSTALIESALRAVHRGAELTDKLLAFGRRQQLRPAPVDAPGLLQDIRLLLERTLGDGVDLHVAVAANARPAFADASQLDAALVNLALNARDAMPDGGTITIAVDERWVATERPATGLKPGHYVVYSVADTGSGMTPEIAARAIEPFFSTKGGRGSGLGLSSVYGFVQQSGGGMDIDSTPGVGTSVSLYLPVSSVPGSEAAHAPAQAHDLAPGKALVVEDDDEVRAVAVAFVRSLAYSVVAVPGYQAAVAALGEDGDGFDIVFSDLMLGNGPDGAALGHYVRQRWPDIGVVLTSGHAQGTKTDAGAFEMLRKPYDREQLAAALARGRRATPKAG